MGKVLAAVAWPYANGPRHIGHVAGFGVPSDVFSRYMRMAGHDVLMVSGTDEHGTPILIAADEAGVPPQQLVDRNHRLIVEDLVGLGLSYDLYTRTTTRNHDGQLNLSVVGGRDALPSLQRIALYIGEALDELHDAAMPPGVDR